MKKGLLVFTLVLMFAIGGTAAELSFSGDASLVSTYVWRGVTQFNGAAMQGTAEVGYGALAIGYWISTMGGPMAAETDPYIGLTLPTGPIETSVGATVYSYDFFAKKGYTVYEVFASAGFGPLGVSLYYTPTQDDPGVTDALYWVEVSAGSSVMGADVSATLSFGNYSALSTDESASNLLLSASKAVSEAIAVSWNWNIALTDGPGNAFFMGLSHAF